MWHQYNFRIDEELKNDIEQELEKANVDNKAEFLRVLLNAYKIQKATKPDIEIDFSKYDNLDKQLKESFLKAINLALKSLDGGLSMFKTEALDYEKKKVELNEKEREINNKIKDLKLEYEEKIKKLQNEKTESEKISNELLKNRDTEIKKLLEKLKYSQKLNEEKDKEISNLKLIAENTKSVMEENKRLKEEIKSLKKEYEEKSIEYYKLLGKLESLQGVK